MELKELTALTRGGNWSIVKHDEMVSFGKDDFELYQAHPEISQLMACNPEYNYYLSILRDLSSVSYSKAYGMALNRMLQERHFEGDAQDVTMQILHESGYFKYEKKRIK